MPEEDLRNQKKHVVSFALLFVHCSVKKTFKCTDSNSQTVSKTIKLGDWICRTGQWRTTD